MYLMMHRPCNLAFQDMMVLYGMCLSSVIGLPEIGLAAARSMASMVSCNSVTALTLGLAARSKNSNLDVIRLPRTSLSYL